MTDAQPDLVHLSAEKGLLADAAQLGRYAIELEAVLHSVLSSDVLARLAGPPDSAAPSIAMNDATTALLADTATQLRSTDAAFGLLRSPAPAHPVVTA